MVGSQKWGYIRIISGTILGGVLGFYVMHRLETSYKEKMRERLMNYEKELKRREKLDEFEDSSMMLHFGDPVKLKTKKVVFEEIYIASDCGTLEQLKELSSRRRAIEESVNGSSFITEAIAREMAGGLTSQHQQDLQKLEQYLPLLQNLVFHADLVSSDPQMVRWTSDLKIRWASALSASSVFNLMGPKFFHINNLRFELGMTLFLYGAILRERALEVLSTDLVQSATLYRKAAGVYHYLAHEVLPSLPALALEIPPEATSSVSSVMSLICLAETQAVTIRKAEEKGSAGGLLAKLHHGITQLLDEATGVLHSATGECKVISVRFVHQPLKFFSYSGTFKPPVSPPIFV